MKSIFCKKLIVYMSSALIFASAPLPVRAAENSQPSSTQAENVPSDHTQTDNIPADNTSAQNPPMDNTNIPAGTDGMNPLPAQNPDDMVITPQPEIQAADGNSVIISIQATIYVSATGGVNVRSGPSTNDSILGKLKYGTELTAIGQTSDNWYQVQYSGGIGYVRADNVSDTPVTIESPGVQSPDATAPDAPDTQAPETQSPDAWDSDPEETTVEQISEESTGETADTQTTRLFGTPVVVVLVLAIIGVLALITLSVISLFKKDNGSDADYGDTGTENDEYFEAYYYEDEDEKE